MAYWIELRCEDRDESYADFSYYKKCWSYFNYGLGDLAFDTVKDLLATRSAIECNAKKAGWKKLSRGWVCPHCVEHSKLNQGNNT